MKTTFIVLIFTSMTFSAFSQLQVEKPLKKVSIGKVAPAGQFLAELYYYVPDDGDKDTTYSLMYKNQEYETLFDLQHLRFSSEGNTIKELYKLLQTFFTDENKKNKDYKVNIKLGQDQILLTNYRQMGIGSVFITTPKGYFILTERQVDKLFGKK